MKKVTQKYEINLFHVHGYSMLMFAYFAKVFTGTKYIATFHPSLHSNDPDQIKVGLSFKRRLGYRAYLNIFSPQAFIAISSDIEKFLVEELHLYKNKVNKILNGVDTKYFRAPSTEERQNARKQIGLQDGEFVCTLVGRLSWNKGHDVLIKAVRQMKSLCPEIPIKCLFIGSGDREDKIKEYAFTNDIDRNCFIFFGFVDRLREIYWASDVFVLPSRLEGFALVVAEAMSCGTVPIRTPGGAFDQIEDGENGFIVPFDDSETLALRLKQLLENQQLRSQMSQAALKVAQEKFTMNKMTEDTILIYEQVIRKTS
jgi:glycosyltransferase involved in cell wall biosynthesis